MGVGEPEKACPDPSGVRIPSPRDCLFRRLLLTLFASSPFQGFGSLALSIDAPKKVKEKQLII